jgi:hypothetical protein
VKGGGLTRSFGLGDTRDVCEGTRFAGGSGGCGRDCLVSVVVLTGFEGGSAAGLPCVGFADGCADVDAKRLHGPNGPQLSPSCPAVIRDRSCQT